MAHLAFWGKAREAFWAMAHLAFWVKARELF